MTMPSAFQSPAQAVSEAVKAIFGQWTALILVIDHQLGGDARGVDRLFQTTVMLALSQTPVYTARHLAAYFAEEFDRLNVDIEDGSTEQVATNIIKVRDAASRGDYQPAMHYVNQQPSTNAAALSKRAIEPDEGNEMEGTDAGQNAYSQNNVDMGEKESAEGNHSHSHSQQVDDDGFTSVVKGGRHH